MPQSSKGRHPARPYMTSGRRGITSCVENHARKRRYEGSGFERWDISTAQSPATSANSPDSSKWLWLVVAIVVGVAIAAMPTPHGLHASSQNTSLHDHRAFTVVLWASPAMNNGVASVLMMGLMVLAGVRPPLALSGFSAPSWWILVCVLYYGFAMKKTGLAERLSLLHP